MSKSSGAVVKLPGCSELECDSLHNKLLATGCISSEFRPQAAILELHKRLEFVCVCDMKR